MGSALLQGSDVVCWTQLPSHAGFPSIPSRTRSARSCATPQDVTLKRKHRLEEPRLVAFRLTILQTFPLALHSTATAATDRRRTVRRPGLGFSIAKVFTVLHKCSASH